MNAAQLAAFIPAVTALITAVTALVALILHSSNPNAHSGGSGGVTPAQRSSAPGRHTDPGT